MDKIKNFFAGMKSEAKESVKGISKGAIATALWIETLLILMLITVCLLSVMRLALSESMTSHALELRANAIEERDIYKALYDSALKEIELLCEAPPGK